MNVAVRETKGSMRGIVRAVYKQMGRAIADYHMLSDGDRILVAVSGGLDSLSLLKLFQLRQRRIPIHFDIIACFVDTSFIHVDRKSLGHYFHACGIEYIIQPLAISPEQINCFWCSWNRRKLIFAAARQANCNKIAFGHNLDDISETILMNICFRGEVSASVPSLEMFGGQIRLIRPLCYVQKRDILAFAKHFPFPDTGYECPHGQFGSRHKIKVIIQSLEEEFPAVKKNIYRSLSNIKDGYLL